jgi:molybdopterin-binding protein
MSPPTPAVVIQDLEVLRADRTALSLPALTIPRGGVHVIVGGNGAGKTTLLRLIAGLQRPSRGMIEVLGASPTSLRGEAALTHRRRLTLCAQQPWLFDRSVAANVGYGLAARGVPRPEQERRVARALEALDLTHLTARSARALSGGEAQRVSLARALAVAPELVLLDEPLASVDAPQVVMAERAIRALDEAGVTVILATHDPERAYRLSGDVVRLEGGRLAPPLLENVLEGRVVEDTQGVGLRVGEALRLAVVTEARGPARAAIDPGAVVVSSQPFASSARNHLSGEVTALEERAGRVVVTVDVGVPLVVHLTRASFEELSITLGSAVHLSFKATAVHLF